MTAEAERIAAVERENEDLRRRLQALEAWRERLAANGLRVGESGSLFNGSGGLVGDSPLYARANHTH